YYCRYAQAEEAARKALLHYRRAGWPVSACLGTLAASLLNGPTPVSSAIPECEQLLDGADLNGEANVLPFLAALQAMKGDFEQAREQLRRARSLYRELGQTAAAEFTCGSVASEIELLAGDEAKALEALERSRAVLDQIGERAYLATRTAQVANPLYRKGILTKAERSAQ